MVIMTVFRPLLDPVVFMSTVPACVPVCILLKYGFRRERLGMYDTIFVVIGLLMLGTSAFKRRDDLWQTLMCQAIVFCAVGALFSAIYFLTQRRSRRD